MLDRSTNTRMIMMSCVALADGAIWLWLLDQGFLAHYLYARSISEMSRQLSNLAWIMFSLLVVIVVAIIFVARWQATRTTKATVLAVFLLTVLAIGIAYGRSSAMLSIGFKELVDGKSTMLTTWSVSIVVTFHTGVLVWIGEWFGRRLGE